MWKWKFRKVNVLELHSIAISNPVLSVKQAIKFPNWYFDDMCFNGSVP